MAAGNLPPTSLIPIVVSTLLLVFLHGGNVASAMSSIKAMSKDQVACEFCSACDNPCQPVYSPPPPSPPPPSPPLPSTSNCPPPPSPPPSSNYCPPPPYTGGGGSYYPPPAQVSVVPDGPPGYFPNPAPPNPIVPYFPFYYYSPPPPGSSSAQNNSISFAKPTNSILSLLLLLLLIPYLIFFQI